MLDRYFVLESASTPGKYYAGVIFFRFEDFSRALKFTRKKNLQYHMDKASQIEPFKIIEIYEKKNDGIS